MLWLGLCPRYFLLARSDQMSATDSGAVHSVHCLTRVDVAFSADGTQLQCMQRRQAYRIKVPFKRHKDISGTDGKRTRADTDQGLPFEVVL